MAIRLKIYHNQNNIEPFTEWLEDIGDNNADAKIRLRLRRIENGGDFRNFRTLGDYKKLKGVDDLLEFRISGRGPGYRIYWGRIGKDVLLLLRGGVRATQVNDIKDAKADWAEHSLRGLGPSDYRDFIPFLINNVSLFRRSGRGTKPDFIGRIKTCRVSQALPDLRRMREK